MNNEINVITIEKNVPIPELTWKGNSKRYNFVSPMEILDSFAINGNTPSFSCSGVRAYIYGLNKSTDRRYTIRTTKGSAHKPIAIRVWRIV